MKNIPNCISISRIILAVALIFLEIFSIPFFIVYACCGVTDMIDGFVARHFNLTSELGAKIDSIADLTFLTICLIKVIPAINLPIFIYIWIIAIIVIKLIGVISGTIQSKKLVMLHTIPNKITGFALFVVLFFVKLPVFEWLVIMVCCLATYSAIHETICVFNKIR